MDKGDKAIVKVGFHTFDVGEVITFQGMDYDNTDLEVYVFVNDNGIPQHLVKSEFKLEDDN